MAPEAAVAAMLLALALPCRTARAQAGPTPLAADSVRRLLDHGDRAEALAYARGLTRTSPNEATSQAALAVAAMAVQDYELAVKAADRMLKRAPDVSAHQLILGQAYLSHARASPGFGAISKVKRGRAAVERAIELDPDNLDARYTLMQFLLQAPGFAGGSREGARRQAEEIERRDRVLGTRARLEIAIKTGEDSALREVFERAVPIVAALPDTSPEPIGALMAAAGNLDDERLREELTAMIYAASPAHPVAAYHRARLWIIEGERLAEAERLLLAYLARPERRGGSASRAGAHWRLAQLYDRLDREERAKEQYQLAARLDPRLRAGNRIPPRLQAQL
jgi:tetratricopeptide (TPR) repeat protein